MMIRIFLAALGALWLAMAAAAAPVRTDNVEAELHSARAAAAPGETVTLVLRQKIRDGWHTYWRNPGDSGEPTMLFWRGPEGSAAGPLLFPPPEAIPFGPPENQLVNYGYHGEVLFPFTVSIPADAKPGETLSLGAVATWLVCEEICIPEEATLSLALPIAAQGKDAPDWAGKINAAMAAIPKEAGLTAKLSGRGEARTLAISGAALTGFTGAHFFPFAGDLINHAIPQNPKFSGQSLTVQLAAGMGADLGARRIDGIVRLERADGTIAAFVASTDPAATAAAEKALAAAPAGTAGPPGGSSIAPLPQSPMPSSGDTLGFGMAVLFAFLGGLILNIMPCVLPVLSLKALSLAKGASPAAARADGLSYFGGVMATFLALAGVLIALTQAGAAAGWGFQLQEPWVVGALALLFFVIGLNLLGAFEIGGGVQNVGAGLTAKAGPAGAFFTGALAVLAATPCTAPFMAGAMGFAATQPPVMALGVFAALGLGFALPMTALSFLPALQRALPKPGAWMDTFKQFLAFPMFATAVWLAWILAALSGETGVLVLLSAAAAIGFLIWALGAAKGFAPRAGAAALAALLVAGVAYVSSPRSLALTPEPWSPARVAELTAAGTPVFVNFTADWCVTCKVNERAALASESLAAAFAAKGVVYLKADWTARDDVIAQTLKSYGRTGVPLYLAYPSGAAEPQILPQVLTEAAVIAAFGDR